MSGRTAGLELGRGQSLPAGAPSLLGTCHSRPTAGTTILAQWTRGGYLCCHGPPSTHSLNLSFPLGKHKLTLRPCSEWSDGFNPQSQGRSCTLSPSEPVTLKGLREVPVGKQQLSRLDMKLRWSSCHRFTLLVRESTQRTAELGG